PQAPPAPLLLSATEFRLLALAFSRELRTTSLNPRAPCPQPPRKESPRLPESEARPSGGKLKLSPAVGSDGHAERAATRHDAPVHPRGQGPRAYSDNAERRHRHRHGRRSRGSARPFPP